MDSLARSAWIGLGAILGANLRYWIGIWAVDKGPDALPWVTFAINVVGSVLIGAFFAAEPHGFTDPSYRLVIATGFCGGFTTFSAFSWDTVQYLNQGKWSLAALYVGASVVMCIVGAWIGFTATQTMLQGRS